MSHSTIPSTQPKTTISILGWILTILLVLILLFLIVLGVVRGTQNRKLLSAETVTSIPISATSSSHPQSYGFLTLSKKQFQKLPYRQIKEFVNWAQQTKDYQYILVMFDDSTALQMNKDKITYGMLSPDSSTVSPIRGWVKDTGKCFVLTDSQGKAVTSTTHKKGINGISRI